MGSHLEIVNFSNIGPSVLKLDTVEDSTEGRTRIPMSTITFMILVGSITLITCTPLIRLFLHFVGLCRMHKLVTGSDSISSTCNTIIPASPTILVPVKEESSPPHYLNLNQEPEDMESGFRTMESHDNLVHRDNDIKYNFSLEIGDNEDLPEFNMTDEEKTLKQTLERTSESAAVHAKIASENDREFRKGQ